MTDAYATHREILSQPEAWKAALQVASHVPLPEASDFREVVFTGCGSAFYLAVSAAALYQELTARAARAVPASELLLNPHSTIQAVGSPSLLMAISRSGTTTETLRAAERWKSEHRGKVVAIGTTEAALSQLADMIILLPKAREESVVQTRAFTSMYLAVTVLCARIGGNSGLIDTLSLLPEVGGRLMHRHEGVARELGTALDHERFFFLGSGIRYGLACEANLKMKEMALTHSEAFHFLEFRHGPMSMVDQQTVVVGLLSDKDRDLEMAVLNEMKKLGATVLTLGEIDADIAFQSAAPELARPVLYLPCLQLMALHRCLAKGLNPDRPRHLAAAVHLDL